MGVTAATYPPLGQVTCVPKRDVTFTSVIQVPRFQAREPWEASIWHSIDGSEWAEARGSRLPDGEVPFSPQKEPPSTTPLYFSVKLPVTSICAFTLRFRSGHNELWRWVRDEVGTADGTVIVQAASGPDSSDNIRDVMKYLSPEWRAVPQQSQAPRTQLWSLDASVSGAQGEQSTQKVIPLGVPWERLLRWFSLARVSQAWIAPVHGNCRLDLSPGTVLCSFLNDKGQHLVMLAVSGVRGVSTEVKTESEAIVVQVRNDSPTDEQATILVSVGNDFSQAVAAVMYHARGLVSGLGAERERFGKELATLVADVQPHWRENWYDGLGYCTWNALGQDLSDQKLFDALDKLAANHINVTHLIIDDNWQSVEEHGEGQANRRWLEFEAEPEQFPRGLKGTVDYIREKHTHINHVAVWHALFGYWGGISIEGKIAKEYKTVDVHRRYDFGEGNQPDGPMTVVAGEDAGRFYDDFYRFLSSCGVDGVKADAQGLLDAITSATDRQNLTHPYLDAWNIASLRHFGDNVISCMSLAPQIVFHNQLPHSRPRFLCRNSDDFFPENPGAHSWHVWVNAFNSIFTRYLNVVPDWDMFQTAGQHAAFHAAARCVSGGPVCITDVPGEHDLELIGEITARTIREKTVILRPSVPARAIDPYVSYEDNVLLKVGGYNGSSNGTPILAIFNVSSCPLTELIHLSAFPGASNAAYVVTSHVHLTVSGALNPEDPSALLELLLDIRGFDILTAFPLTRIGDVDVASLGLRGKMTGAAAIVSSTFSETENNRVLVKTRLKALGVLGLYISHLHTLSIDDDFIATISDCVIPPSTVSISPHSDRVLEIDVEKAWMAVGVPPGWGNEVEVKVYFTLRK